jgi:hypothetical protein
VEQQWLPRPRLGTDTLAWLAECDRVAAFAGAKMSSHEAEVKLGPRPLRTIAVGILQVRLRLASACSQSFLPTNPHMIGPEARCTPRRCQGLAQCRISKIGSCIEERCGKCDRQLIL